MTGEVPSCWASLILQVGVPCAFKGCPCRLRALHLAGFYQSPLAVLKNWWRDSAERETQQKGLCSNLVIPYTDQEMKAWYPNIFRSSQKLKLCAPVSYAYLKGALKGGYYPIILNACSQIGTALETEFSSYKGMLPLVKSTSEHVRSLCLLISVPITLMRSSVFPSWSETVLT